MKSDNFYSGTINSGATAARVKFAFDYTYMYMAGTSSQRFNVCKVSMTSYNFECTKSTVAVGINVLSISIDRQNNYYVVYQSTDYCHVILKLNSLNNVWHK